MKQTRRELLTGSSTIAAIAIAGCGGQLEGDDESDSDNQNGEQGGEPETATSDIGGVTAQLFADGGRINRGENITIDATSSEPEDGIVSYQFDFDDGTSFETSGGTVTYAFDEGGEYDVSVTVEDGNGSADTDSISILVEGGSQTAAEAALTVTPEEVQRGQAIDLDASDSKPGDERIHSYEWEFGDGAVRETDTPEIQHEYSDPGEYEITLSVVDEEGNMDTTTERVVVREADSDSETAAVDARLSLTPGEIAVSDVLDVDASTSSSGSGSIVTYSWEFDNGRSFETEVGDIGHGYEVPGEYEITVTVVDEDGNTDTATESVTVTEPENGSSGGDEVDANLSVQPTSVDPGETIDVDATASTSSGGSVQSYEWDFGDGSSFETESGDIGYGFDNEGEYDITVTIVDSNGDTDADTVTVSVGEPSQTEPTVEADLRASPSDPRPGEGVTLDAGGSDSRDGTVVIYEWDFDNGTEYGTQHSTVSVTYTEEGTYEPTVLAFDTEENGDTATVSLTVEASETDDGDVQAELTADGDEAQIGEKIHFDAGGSDSESIGIVEYEWDVGDGTTLGSDTSTINYGYQEPGTYEVTVTVIDAEGNTGTATTTVTIVEADDDDEGDEEDGAGDGDEEDGDEDGDDSDEDEEEDGNEDDSDEEDAGDGTDDCEESSGWDEETVYDPDDSDAPDRALYDGMLWEAQWWTRGDEPGSSEWGPWEKLAVCDGSDDESSDDDDEESDEEDDGDSEEEDSNEDGEYSEWNEETLYGVGDRVTYDGSIWEAEIDSRNAEPSADSAYWGEV